MTYLTDTLPSSQDATELPASLEGSSKLSPAHGNFRSSGSDEMRCSLLSWSTRYRLLRVPLYNVSTKHHLVPPPLIQFEIREAGSV